MEWMIEPKLKEIAPALSLGIVTGRIINSPYHEQLWHEIKITEEKILNQFELSQVNKIPEIAAVRATYKKAGKDPSRYRGSSEALMRRILNRKGLYQVNTIVDMNNLVSLATKCPVGTYDLDKLASPFVFRIGEEGEVYKGIGKEEINLHGLPIFCDQQGPFGSPTSDSERSMITLDTQQIMMAIISFGGETHLNEAIDYGKKLLQWAQLNHENSYIVE